MFVPIWTRFYDAIRQREWEGGKWGSGMEDVRSSSEELIEYLISEWISFKAWPHKLPYSTFNVCHNKQDSSSKGSPYLLDGKQNSASTPILNFLIKVCALIAPTGPLDVFWHLHQPIVYIYSLQSIKSSRLQEICIIYWANQTNNTKPAKREAI